MFQLVLRGWPWIPSPRQLSQDHWLTLPATRHLADHLYTSRGIPHSTTRPPTLRTRLQVRRTLPEPAKIFIILACEAYCRTVSVHPSVHLSICVSVRDSLSHAYVRSIARHELPRLPACYIICKPPYYSVKLRRQLLESGAGTCPLYFLLTLFLFRSVQRRTNCMNFMIYLCVTVGFSSLSSCSPRTKSWRRQ